MADEGVPDASWHLPGSIATADSSGVGAFQVVAAGTGMPSVTLTGGQPHARLAGFSPTSLPYLAWALDANGSVAFGTGSSARSSEQLNALLDQAAAAEMARPAKAPFASRYVRRAPLIPQANPGSVYRCGKSA